MNRSELVRKVAARAGLGMAEADAAVKAVLAALADGWARGGPARTGRNPRSDSPIAIPVSRAASAPEPDPGSLRSGKALKDAVIRVQS